MPVMAILTVNAVFSATLAMLVGKMNLHEGWFAFAGRLPIGTGLHEPPSTCKPLVMVLPTQKLMKLLVEVAEAT